jgi:hypothetical protein
MSVLAIANSIFSQIDSLAAHSKSRQLKQGFQQLGQDLQSGNLSQSQGDFASLQQFLPGGPQSPTVTSPTSAQGSNLLAVAVSQLAQDLKSGNLTAAQSDITTVQQDVQQTGQQQQGVGQAHLHHHHAGSAQSSGQQDPISTLFGQLGRDLQSGNVSGAQQAYASLQQDFQNFALNNSSTSSTSSPNASSGNFSVSV